MKLYINKISMSEIKIAIESNFDVAIIMDNENNS